VAVQTESGFLVVADNAMCVS